MIDYVYVVIIKFLVMMYNEVIVELVIVIGNCYIIICIGWFVCVNFYS